MTWIGTVTVVGLVMLIALVFVLKRMFQSDQIQALLDKRKGSATALTRAEFVEGMEKIPVALALSQGSIFYENADLQAELELSGIDEVEYDDELSTGKEVPNGRVLRLRSHGRAIEFILDKEAAGKWLSALPPHHMNEPGRVHATT